MFGEGLWTWILQRSICIQGHWWKIDMWQFQTLPQCRERIYLHANVCQRISNSSLSSPAKYWSQCLDSVSNKSLKAGTQSHCWGRQKLYASSWACGQSQGFSQVQGLYSSCVIISLCDLRQMTLLPHSYFFVYKKWQGIFVGVGEGRISIFILKL